MPGIVFEWDERKNAANLRKHGVGFAEASSVFDDAFSVTIPDPDHSSDEDRFVIVGVSDKRNLPIVVHPIRAERIRLIGARPATRQERRQYEDSN